MTIIIPAAGNASRYKTKKPKFLLTHPNGKLMIEMILEECIRLGHRSFSIGIQEKHNRQFNAARIFQHLEDTLRININLTMIEGLSRGPADTVRQIINHQGVEGPIIVKDADNLLSYPKTRVPNFIVTASISDYNINDVHSKSFVKLDSRGFIQDIFEKQIVSSEVCLGAYGFKCVDDYLNSYSDVERLSAGSEIYVSMIVSNLILNGHLFASIKASNFTDWGVWARWKEERKKFSTYFIDFDGTLVKNTGKYGASNWDSAFEPLSDNMKLISKIHKEGAQIIITTSRPHKYKKIIKAFLKEYEINPKAIITDLHHSQRIIINDHAETNPFPACAAISIPRDSNISEYLDD